MARAELDVARACARSPERPSELHEAVASTSSADAPARNRDPRTAATVAPVGRRAAACLAFVLVPVLVLIGGCGGGSSDRVATKRATRRTTTTTSTTTTTTTTTTTLPPSTTTAPPAPPPAEAVAEAAPAPSGPSDGQLIVVSADDFGQSTATFTAYEHVDGGWRTALGPWTANIGRAGFAPEGEKAEGDGRTPSGTYGFSFFFGIRDDPGVAYEYRRIDDPSIVWDDDPSSANYNEWVDTRTGGDAGIDPEPMYNSPAYDHGAVIAYNTARTPGVGSAIFFHVSTGGSTAGCVSLPGSEVVQVLRWLDPGLGPQISMGVGVGAP